MSYALLFAGQGSQHAEMLPWLEQAPEAREVLEQVGKMFKTGWRTVLADPSLRVKNSIAQPLIVGIELAAHAVLRALLPVTPRVVAGYSVGELAAFGACGTLSVDSAVALAVQRAQLMDQAVQGCDTGLLAVRGVDESTIIKACPQISCAIRIDQDHNIFGGTSQALEHLENIFASRAEFTRLCVAVASHTPLMSSAYQAFSEKLALVNLRAPESPVAANALGATSRDTKVLGAALARQICSTVQWGSCMDAVLERGPSCVLEIGGGQALSRMWNARHPSVPARSLDDFRSVEGAAAWITAHE